MNNLQISYFLTICKYNSFTETARRLYVSQPAISKQIFALEDELGMQLFRREYKKIYLTEEGKIFRDAFEKNLATIDEAKRKAYQIKHQNNYALSIAVLQGLEPSDILYPLLQRFEKVHPNVTISLECLAHEKLNSLLRINELDYAITLSQEVKNDKLVCSHDLYSAELAFTMHASHPLYNNPSISKTDLKGQTILVSTTGAKDTSGFFNVLLHQWGLDPEQFLYLSSLDEVISYAASGTGIALLSMQTRFHKYDFKQIPLAGFQETISGAWYYNNHNPALKMLLDILSE